MLSTLLRYFVEKFIWKLWHSNLLVLFTCYAFGSAPFAALEYNQHEMKISYFEGNQVPPSMVFVFIYYALSRVHTTLKDLVMI
jgi:hypothetical protein